MRQLHNSEFLLQYALFCNPSTLGKLDSKETQQLKQSGVENQLVRARVNIRVRVRITKTTECCTSEMM